MILKRNIASLLLVLCFLLPTATQAANDLKVIRDDEIEKTLRVFGTPIFEEAGLQPLSVNIILLEDSEINAFVAGGQNIFVNTGLLLKSDNAMEVAGVLAHETGHISGGHLFRAQETVDNLSFQALLANILGVAAAIGAKSADVGLAVSSAGQSLALRSILRHTRIQESAADQAGVRFLRGADLPLSGFVSFMEKLSSQELLPDSEQSAYVRTHPLSRDRVDFLKNAQSESAQSTPPAAWDDLHARMKAKLEGYLYPDRALARKDASFNTRYAQAIAWYRKNKSDKAMALIDALLKEEPQNPYLYELQGQALFEQGRIAASIAPYAKAVAQAPKSGLIRAAYGHALLENGQTVEAIAALEKSLDTEERSSRAHHLLAMGYGRQGREGLSRLHLAEEALLQNKLDLAEKEANMALRALPEKSASRLRVRDILDQVTRKRKKKKD